MLKNHEQISRVDGGRQEIIDSLVSSAREEEDGDKRIIYISYGRKEMKIEIRKKTDVSGGKLVTTFIENKASDQNKRENETTLLYSAAKNIIQNIADSSGQALYYIFDTENNKLAEWARTSGKEIFQWDDTDKMAIKPSQHTFSKIFKPAHQ